MGMISEFKQFAMRGNVIDMAVGIVIGAAFGKIVSSLVADVITPAIGLLVGGVDFSGLVITLKEAVAGADGKIVTPAVTLNYGVFIQTVFDFVIIAFAIFMLIRAVNRIQRKKEEEPAAPPVPSEEVKLLTEIRDALKAQN